MTPLGDIQDAEAIYSVAQGKRPQRPAHPYVTGGLWKLIQRCWDERPRLRPEASEILQILLYSSVPHVLLRSPVRRLDHTFVPSNPPAWKRLISPALPQNERIDLISSIFSDCDEFEIFKYLSGEDSQAFVDVTYEVSIRIILALKATKESAG